MSSDDETTPEYKHLIKRVKREKEERRAKAKDDVADAPAEYSIVISSGNRRKYVKKVRRKNGVYSYPISLQEYEQGIANTNSNVRY